MTARRFALPIAASCLVLAACSPEATGQSVAVVNGEEISVAELNAELATANIPASADRKQVMPQLLQRVVDRRLLAQQASEQGVDKSPEFLNRQRRLTEDLLIGLASKRQADSIRIPDAREVDAFIAANPSMFRDRAILNLDQIQFEVPSDPNVLQRLRGTRGIAQVASTLTALGVPFIRTPAKLDTATVPPDVMRQINALPAGEAFVVPIAGRMYASVIVGREAAPASDAQNRRVAVEAMRRQTLQASLERQLKQLRSAAEIEYQDGYAPPAQKAAPKAATKT